jgi:hypothetical protein
MPDGVTDRKADVWEALLAVTDAAGADWPTKARAGAVALVAQAKQTPPSLGIMLLQHLHDVFGDADGLWTEAILERLHNLKEAAWSDIRGKPLNDRGLAQRLGNYQVHSKDVRENAGPAKVAVCGMTVHGRISGLFSQTKIAGRCGECAELIGTSA